MKKIFLSFIMILFTIPSLTMAYEQIEIKCPNPNKLLQATEDDQEKLMNALHELIPKVYGTSQEYKEWRIEVIKPMRELTGENHDYYEMAKNFCGEEVANLSWFVRLRFPKLLPAQSASLGEIYVVQDKQHNWIVWFQYH